MNKWLYHKKYYVIVMILLELKSDIFLKIKINIKMSYILGDENKKKIFTRTKNKKSLKIKSNEWHVTKGKNVIH